MTTPEPPPHGQGLTSFPPLNCGVVYPSPCMSRQRLKYDVAETAISTLMLSNARKGDATCFSHLLCSRRQGVHQAVTDIEAAGQHFALCRERQLCVPWLLASLGLIQSCLTCCVGYPLALHVGKVKSMDPLLAWPALRLLASSFSHPCSAHCLILYQEAAPPASHQGAFSMQTRRRRRATRPFQAAHGKVLRHHRLSRWVVPEASGRGLAQCSSFCPCLWRSALWMRHHCMKSLSHRPHSAH